jgi:hypothetical protein
MKKNPPSLAKCQIERLIFKPPFLYSLFTTIEEVASPTETVVEELPLDVQRQVL